VESLGWNELGGRTVSLATDPRDASGSTVWAGSAGGGVWRSTDGGKGWTPTFDDQPSMAIGAIAISPTTGWVYAGTGEANTNGDGLSGTGIYRTKDSGRLGARREEPRRGEHRLPRRRQPRPGAARTASRRDQLRACSPAPTAATATPTRCCRPTPTAPRRTPRPASATTSPDVRVKPASPTPSPPPSAGAAARRSAPTASPTASATASTAPPRAARPALEAHGHQPRQGAAAPGLSSDPIGRTSLSYASGEGQDHDILWAVVQDAGVFRNETFLGAPLPAKPTVLAGVYVSRDNGSTWELKATPAQFAAAPGTVIAPLLALQSGPGVQAWYDQYVEVDPADQNRVIIGLEEIYSTVGNPYLPGLAGFKTIGRYWNTCVPLSTGAPTCTEAGPADLRGRHHPPGPARGGLRPHRGRRPPLRLQRRRRVRSRTPTPGTRPA
jgi:hypothetical protein